MEEGWLPSCPPSDHVPLKTQVAFVAKGKEARKRYFREMYNHSAKKHMLPCTRIPVTWEPRSWDRFRDLAQEAPCDSLDGETQRLNAIALGEALTADPHTNPELRELAVKSTKSQNSGVEKSLSASLSGATEAAGGHAKLASGAEQCLHKSRRLWTNQQAASAL